MINHPDYPFDEAALPPDEAVKYDALMHHIWRLLEQGDAASLWRIRFALEADDAPNHWLHVASEASHLAYGLDGGAGYIRA